MDENTTLLNHQRGSASKFVRSYSQRPSEVTTPTTQSSRAFRRSASLPHGRAMSVGRSLSVAYSEAIASVPVPKTRGDRRKIYMSTIAILVTVLFERTTYFSIVGNLVLFCTSYLGLTTTVAVTVNLVFTGGRCIPSLIDFSLKGVSYMVPLVCGRIADTIAGRFNAIFGCFLIYFIGTALLPAVALDYGRHFGYDPFGFEYGLPMSYKRGYFLAGIILVAIGAGGIKANISPFGAQQVEPIGQEAVHSFFNWFYWFVNMGGCVAYLAVVYVQQEMGFFLGYLIPTLTLAVGLALFLIPRNVYSSIPHGNVVGFIISLLWEGTYSRDCQCLCCCCEPTPTPKLVGLERTPEASSPESSPEEEDDNAFRSPTANLPSPKWLDPAKVSYGGSFADDEVENMKRIIRTVPIFMTLILFSTFTSQNTTTMLLQGERLDPNVGNFKVPAATLNIFKMIMIVLLIPLLDRIVYPLLLRYGRLPTLLQRMGFGMLAGVVSLVCMGMLEIARKNDLATTGGHEENIGGTPFNASSINILWQVPQFMLTGVGETFTLITALEFAYTESPIATQGLVMGMNHLTTGLGNLLGSAIYNAVASVTDAAGQPWLPDEINNGYLDYFVFLLAGILLLNFIIFLLLARCYEYSHLGATSSAVLPNCVSPVGLPNVPRPVPIARNQAHDTRSRISFANQLYFDS